MYVRTITGVELQVVSLDRNIPLTEDVQFSIFKRGSKGVR